MSIISDNLIHFLARVDKDNPSKQFEVCKQIFEHGLRTSKVLVKFPDGAYVYNQAICFTDIPLKECNEHTAIYGKFGIGFKKSYVKNTGGNPARYYVDYVPGHMDTPVNYERRGFPYFNIWHQFKFFKLLNDQLNVDPDFALFDKDSKVLLNHQELREYLNSLLYTFSFDKEMGDLGPARDETKEIDLYYKEREWRLVPSAVDLAMGIYDEKNNVAHYKFNRDDVNMVVVPNEEMRTLVLNHFLNLPDSGDERMNQFRKNPLPIIHYDDLQKW